jgi:heterodisulfide reductase subunit A-like polyferredoxin
MTQVELAEMMDEWEDQAALGLLPARHVVMVQCAGSRDRKRLPYCSRLCCMIALKHAIRLKQLFPQMKVTICYLEMRTAGVGYENWFLAARRAGVEFLRGTPPEVQFDGEGGRSSSSRTSPRPARWCCAPTSVVLSAGMVPAAETRELAETLDIELDEDGFVEILDRKHSATETSGEGIFVCGSAAGPKALIEVTTEASAVASEIHNFLSSAGRRKPRPRPSTPPPAWAATPASRCAPSARSRSSSAPTAPRARPRSRTTASWPSSTTRSAGPAASARPSAPRSRSRTTSPTTPSSAASRR